jgi:hypothetical protein
MSMKRMIQKYTRPEIRFTGSVPIDGYECVANAVKMPAVYHGTLLDQAFQSQDRIVAKSNNVRHFELVSQHGVARCFSPENGIKDRDPLMALVNIIRLVGTDAEAEADDEKAEALAFASVFGLPYGGAEISLSDLQRIAFVYDRKFRNLKNEKLRFLTLNTSHQQRFAADGTPRFIAPTFLQFCNLHLMEVLRLGRRPLECSFCRRWFVPKQKIPSERGADYGDELRFCSGRNCRQRYHALYAADPNSA